MPDDPYLTLLSRTQLVSGGQADIQCSSVLSEIIDVSDTKVQKWGNSMAMRIPAVTVRAWGIQEGQTVALTVEDGSLVVRPKQQRYTLAELLAECDFSHPLSAEEREWIDAPPVGLEDI
ncbi:AbrB/MazE/SpoVT family DNA-binding domain-containing protein [Acidithiobacillus sp. MC6.1]|nr:AbrB/MazE/SpoVT family DNA-binding domain-containing protein [Acidithiobacillus sp. MC6.1]